ncbi:unnamed protein product, partial [Discosporangium mesarthrocarpum]
GRGETVSINKKGKKGKAGASCAPKKAQGQETAVMLTQPCRPAGTGKGPASATNGNASSWAGAGERSGSARKGKRKGKKKGQGAAGASSQAMEGKEEKEEEKKEEKSSVDDSSSSSSDGTSSSDDGEDEPNKPRAPMDQGCPGQGAGAGAGAGAWAGAKKMNGVMRSDQGLGLLPVGRGRGIPHQRKS